MLQPGDCYWQGPAEFDGTDHDGYPMWTRARGGYIPDVPNLAQIARFLAEHPETVDALGRLSNGIANVPVSGSQTMFRRDVDMFAELVKAMRGEGGE